MLLSNSLIVLIGSLLIFLLLISTVRISDKNNITAQAATPILSQTTLHTGMTTMIDIDSAPRIKIQYEKGWSIDTKSYPAGDRGVQIAAFYLPDVKNGLPFVYIGIDNLSKVPDRFPRSLDEYLKESLRYKNSTGFPGFKLLGTNTNGNRLSDNLALYDNVDI